MPNLTVRNHTGYVTADLERFFKRGLEFFGAQKDKVIKVIPTKTDDGRGIAFVGRCAYPREKGACEGKSMVLMLPHPSQLTMRRLARLFEHELKHNLGLSHEQMSEGEYWSRGQLPHGLEAALSSGIRPASDLWCRSFAFGRHARNRGSTLKGDFSSASWPSCRSGVPRGRGDDPA